MILALELKAMLPSPFGALLPEGADGGDGLVGQFSGGSMKILTGEFAGRGGMMSWALLSRLR